MPTLSDSHGYDNSFVLTQRQISVACTFLSVLHIICTLQVTNYIHNTRIYIFIHKTILALRSPTYFNGFEN